MGREYSGSSKLSDDQVREAFELRRKGWTQSAIGKHLGDTQSAVSRILGGEAWRRLGIEPLPKRVSPLSNGRTRRQEARLKHLAD